jgi:tetratricopeptide (TPR) repeat protein
MKTLGLCILAAGLIFSGCSAPYLRGEQAPDTSAPPTAEMPSETPQPPKKPPHRIGAIARSTPSREYPRASSAVRRLEDKATQQLSLGQFDEAFATAERALRMDASNPELWNLLARIQLGRGNADQAEQLARKSNLLAKGDRHLQAKNWKLIAEALRRKGASVQAEEALLRAEELEN